MGHGEMKEALVRDDVRDVALEPVRLQGKYHCFCENVSLLAPSSLLHIWLCLRRRLTRQRHSTQSWRCRRMRRAQSAGGSRPRWKRSSSAAQPGRPTWPPSAGTFPPWSTRQALAQSPHCALLARASILSDPVHSQCLAVTPATHSMQPRQREVYVPSLETLQCEVWGYGRK